MIKILLILILFFAINKITYNKIVSYLSRYLLKNKNVIQSSDEKALYP